MHKTTCIAGILREVHKTSRAGGRFHTVTPITSMKGRSPWRPLSCEASPRSSPLRTVAPAPHVPWKTFLSNVAMGPRFRGLRMAEAHRQAGEWIRVVGLAGFEDHHPHQLSGGIRKRVTLAAALISEPSILLIDEPFGTLDVQTQATMSNELLSLW